MSSGPPCLYCGTICVNIKKGEHIYPGCIGGQKTLTKKNVCSDCNNTVLSLLDENMGSNSYLSLLASQVLNKSYSGQWDIDPQGTLIEASSILCDDGIYRFRAYPQLSLEEKGFAVRGDSIEATGYGLDNFNRTVFQKAKQCYLRFAGAKLYSGDKGIIVEKVAQEDLPTYPHSFPPRIYAKTRIAAFTNRTCMYIRYSAKEDKERILQELKNFDPDIPTRNHEEHLGSTSPQVNRGSDFFTNIRWLLKTGINLLSETCTNTEVNFKTFPVAIDAVLQEGKISKRDLSFSGFVPPEGYADIHNTEGGGHSARLMFNRMIGSWTIYFSFFGGKMAAKVVFPGVSNETWITADVSSPLVSQDPRKTWMVKFYDLYLPLIGEPVWDNPSRLCPSMPFRPGAEFKVIGYWTKPIRKRPTFQAGGIQEQK